MKVKNKIVPLPRFSFPKNIVRCDIVRQRQAAAKEVVKSLEASLHAKYLFVSVSGKNSVLPGKVIHYWEALQQVLHVLSRKD